MTRTRCPSRSVGGLTPDGRLPRKGTQCGLDAGHDGDHTVLIPTDAPWWPTNSQFGNALKASISMKPRYRLHWASSQGPKPSLKWVIYDWAPGRKAAEEERAKSLANPHVLHGLAHYLRRSPFSP